ncbi:MAG: prepilin-type N-terminal cleavage/methylation domain-containing protein [Dissulfuribacterales bacterium]
MYSNRIFTQLEEKGFSLVELMIAMFIFMVVMLGLLVGVNSAIQANKGNVLRDEAVRLAEEELTRLRSEQFTDLGTSGALAATGWTGPNNLTVNIRNGTVSYAVSKRITDINGGALPVKRIDVAVGWNDVGGTGAQAPTNMNYQVVLSAVLVQTQSN